jgi:branched-chain amino acid aminotransferase
VFNTEVRIEKSANVGCEEMIEIDFSQPVVIENYTSQVKIARKTDEHKYVEESGTTNLFFVLDDYTVITPALDGNILKGVTRDSCIKLLRDANYKVEERHINIEEIATAARAGKLFDAFGTGTAATISLIKELRYKDYVMEFDTDSWEISKELKNRVNAIRYGTAPDNHFWMYKI